MTTEITTRYAVEYHKVSAAQPWRVVATFRSFNRVVARYADKQQAQRRARDMNRNAVMTMGAE